jgi:hypothetical protein
MRHADGGKRKISTRYWAGKIKKWIVRLEEWCVSLYAVNQSEHCTRLGGIKEARSARINLCGYFRQIFVIVGYSSHLFLKKNKTN